MLQILNLKLHQYCIIGSKVLANWAGGVRITLHLGTGGRAVDLNIFTE